MDSSALVLSSQLADGNGTDQDGSPQQARVSDLHRLPLELRAQIYEELFFPKSQRGERSEVGKNGTILRTCRSIHLEACYTLYRQTLWRITLGNPDPDLPYRSTSTTAHLSRRQWLLPFFDFESQEAVIYNPLMCRFHVHLKKISWPEDVRSQIDWLARNVLLKAAQPIKHFVLLIDSDDERLLPLRRSILDSFWNPSFPSFPSFSSFNRMLGSQRFKNAVEEAYKKEILEDVKVASAVLGGLLRNVQVASVDVEGCQQFPLAGTEPSVLEVTRVWEERMMSSAEDHPASPLPAMFWAMEDLLNKYGMSDFPPYNAAHFANYVPDRTHRSLLKLRELMEKED